MIKGTHKVLHNKAKLYQMLNLRLMGFSLTSLAAIYGVDWTSIRHHTRYYQIPRPINTINLFAIVSQAIPKQEPLTYKIVNGERINLGKSYKDYLQAQYPHNKVKTY